MSTKSTIDHNGEPQFGGKPNEPLFHLYTDALWSPTDTVYLEMKESEKFPLDFVANPGSVTVAIPFVLWERLAKAWTNYQKDEAKAKKFRTTKKYKDYVRKHRSKKEH